MIYSDLEYYVRWDMIDRGYDPNKKEDIIKYWSERLD